MMGYRTQGATGPNAAGTGATTPTHGPTTHAPVPIVPVGLDLGGTTSAQAASGTGGLQSNRQSPSPLKRAQSRHFDIDTNNPANSASKRSSFSSTTSASSVWPGTSATATDASRTTTPYYNLTQGIAGLGLGGPIGVGVGSGVPSPHPGMGGSPAVVPGMAPIAPAPMAPNAVHAGLTDDDLIPTAIVIKNIPFAIKKEQLLDVMTQLRLPLPYAFNYHFDNGVFRGLAFANFTTADETAAVIGSLNGREIGGRKLRVEYKKMLPLAERERIERDKRERRGQLEEQHRGQGGQGGGRRNVSAQQPGGAPPPPQQQQQQPSLTQSVPVGQPVQTLPSHVTPHMSYPQYSPSPTPTPPPAHKLDLNDPETLEFYSQLLLFRDDAKRAEIVYSHPLLLPQQRQMVMSLCDQLGLIFNSEATGLVVVTRQRQYYEYQY
ncbi:RNA-binding protein [Yarrowia sp. C11]|nr:RNA-binding protein [Yarrowia sp. E02]KAG5369633.1 RNA-binding protein [Yarrowia sp. C11]